MPHSSALFTAFFMKLGPVMLGDLTVAVSDVGRSRASAAVTRAAAAVQRLARNAEQPLQLQACATQHNVPYLLLIDAKYLPAVLHNMSSTFKAHSKANWSGV